MRGPLTPAVFHILLALADGPLHGYAIMQAVGRSAGASMPAGPGTIYGALQRMVFWTRGHSWRFSAFNAATAGAGCWLCDGKCIGPC